MRDVPAAAALVVGRFFQAGLRPVSGTTTKESRLRTLPRANRTASGISPADEGIGRRRGGVDRGFRGQHLPGGVHDPLSRSRLRAALVHEEVETRHQDAQERCRADQTKTKSRGSRPRGARRREETMTRKIKVEIGSGNIFADLGLPDAETHFLKA